MNVFDVPALAARASGRPAIQTTDLHGTQFT